MRRVPSALYGCTEGAVAFRVTRQPAQVPAAVRALGAYGVEPDPERTAYYRLLWDLT